MVDFIRDGLSVINMDSCLTLQPCWRSGCTSIRKGTEQTWFSRKAEEPHVIQRQAAWARTEVIEQLTRNNSLFLSAAAQNNHEMLLPIYNWFWTTLVFVTGDRSEQTKQTIKMCEEDRETRALIARLLSVRRPGNR